MKKILAICLAAFCLCCCSHKTAQEPSFAVQVSLGGWNHAHYTPDEVIGRLSEVSDKIPVTKVIIGWTIDKEAYVKIGEYLHSHGMEMYLWLPVFAETEEVCGNVPAVDLRGEVPRSFALAEDEGFRFNCPTDPGNIRNIVGIYDKYFSECGFDGVFMDRIRTQSFVSGASGVLNCGCQECRQAFLREGVDLESVLEEWERKGDKFLSVSRYDPVGGFTFESPVAEEFFSAKGRIVSGSVATLADTFRGKGLKVGMDLYAPFMARMVGQDYGILSEHADFIKPMLYRKTEAPAGMGFEYGLLRSSIPDATGYPDIAMDVDFLDTQLDGMNCVPCGRFPGIEINYRPDIVETSPEYVLESLSAIKRHGFEGAVLSWNIMEAPTEHIECLSKL